MNVKFSLENSLRFDRQFGVEYANPDFDLASSGLLSENRPSVADNLYTV